MKQVNKTATVVALLCIAPFAIAAVVVPNEIQQPGTQPGEVGNLESPDKCDNCHGGYDRAVEPAFNWRGSMMAQASRDPIFWATLAVAEQDFGGAGDLCIRCHSVDGWNAGRSTPTDGSGLGENDATGVACDLCHKLTNPDAQEWVGVQNAPFIANDGGTPPEPYLGSGMYVLWGGADKLGPYATDDASARHQFGQSLFHRSVDLCGTCHDVSNPAVGDLAPNHGAMVPLEPGTFSGALGTPVDAKAAFNNPPYKYGVVERTFSEYKASLLSKTLVSSYLDLPADLQAGAIQRAYQQAMASSSDGNYFDGAPRYFSCQTCHLPPVTGAGCNKRGAKIRSDLPHHDMTGGNYWMPDVIQYLDPLGRLRLGSGLTQIEIDALNAGKQRAYSNLENAAALSVDGNILKVVNLTGHKLISGYPEGRRMWLHVRWYDDAGTLLREDGKYGTMTVTLDGAPITVETILDLDDPYTKIYEAHYAMTQPWADKLLAVGYDPNLYLGYDRETGAGTHTLGELAAGSPDDHEETFHFVLNNYVEKDNRIPPYGLDYDEALRRSALPVPADQYGNPGPGGVYNYWDEFALTPPDGATYATVDLLYQPTSWEYIQFLYLANHRLNAFLADEGAFLLDAWLNTGMAVPHVMASTTWGTPPGCTPTEPSEVSCTDSTDNDCDDLIDCDDPDCASDPACTVSVCDGDGICNLGEDCQTCPSECAGVLGGKPANRYCCGNGVLESAEGDGSICDGNP